MTKTLDHKFATLCTVPLLLLAVSSCSTAPEKEPELDDATLVSQALAGDIAIKCGYTIDAAEGIIYLHGAEQARFDAVAANGTETHIVSHEGQAHAWSEGANSGVRYPSGGEAGLIPDDQSKFAEFAHDCEIYAGPASIFELPGGVAFQDLPTG